MEFYIGDKVKVVNPDYGCTGALNNIGTVIKKPQMWSGLSESEKECVYIDCRPYGTWKVNADGCELIERSTPTKESLIGEIIVTRNLNEYLVLKTHSGTIFGLNINDTNFYINLNTFDHELRSGTNNEFDIMSVHEVDDITTFDNLYKVKKKTTWKRPEEKVKEMTMAEIESLVGCKVKIIKE